MFSHGGNTGYSLWKTHAPCFVFHSLIYHLRGGTASEPFSTSSDPMWGWHDIARTFPNVLTLKWPGLIYFVPALFEVTWTQRALSIPFTWQITWCLLPGSPWLLVGLGWWNMLTARQTEPSWGFHISKHSPTAQNTDVSIKASYSSCSVGVGRSVLPLTHLLSRAAPWSLLWAHTCWLLVTYGIRPQIWAPWLHRHDAGGS